MQKQEQQQVKTILIDFLVLFGLGFTNEMQKMTTKEFSGGWRSKKNFNIKPFSSEIGISKSSLCRT
jgi:hypothetical protein